MGGKRRARVVEGSLRQREDGTWELRFRHGGETISVYGKTPAAARKNRNEKLAKLGEAPTQARRRVQGLTLRAWAKEWLATGQSPRKGGTPWSEKTRERYRTHIRDLDQRWGGAALARLDGQELTDWIRQQDVKVMFYMPTFDATPAPNHNLASAMQFSSMPDLIDPETNHPKAPKGYRNLKEFLGYIIVWSRGAQLTIKYILRYEAHVRGGVHVGEPKEPGDLAAEALNEVVMFGGLPLSLYHLRSISKCVIHALTPLEQRVRRVPPDAPHYVLAHERSR